MANRSTPQPIPPAARLAELVLSVSRRLTLRDQDGTSAVPLSSLEAMVMRCIDADPGTSPSLIAAKLGLKSSNASAALRDLERKGFLRRTVDPADRRSVHVEATPFAQQNLDLKREQWVRMLESHLPDHEALAGAIAVLDGLDRALDATGRGDA